jgi:pyruvate kinase
MRSGSMTRYLSWLRPRYSPIYAFGQSQAVAQELTLNWGVTPFVMPFDSHELDKNIRSALDILLEKRLLRKANTVVVVSSISAGDQVFDAVQMRVV